MLVKYGLAIDGGSERPDGMGFQNVPTFGIISSSFDFFVLMGVSTTGGNPTTGWFIGL